MTLRAGIAAGALIALALIIHWVRTRPVRRGNPGSAAVETAVYDTDTAQRVSVPEDRSGSAGWNRDGNGWWFENGDGTIYSDGWKTIDGQRYYFTSDGYMATGWVNTGEVRDYYFNADGVFDATKRQKLIALTYDDGPSANTDLILDTLEQYGAKATFFVVGTQADYYRAELKREYDEGMEIGSHTYDHMTLKYHTAEEIRETLDKNDELINSLIGFTPVIMRPTGGGVDETVATSVTKPMIEWDVDTLDWDTKDADNTVKVATENAKDGSVVLMHDLYQATAEASVELIPRLRDMGFKMVTVSELADAYGYTLETGGLYFAFYPGGTEYNKDAGELLAAVEDGYTA